MPELPEVETISRQLDKHLHGKVLAALDVLSDKSFVGRPDDIIGQTVKSVSRRAKTMIFEFGPDLYMLVHLKMTGQLVFQEGGERIAGGHPSHEMHQDLPSKHTRVVFTFDSRSKLYFNDLRKFGWCKVMNKREMDKYFTAYGPDALPPVAPEYLAERAKRMPRSSIKKFLLDQNVISGIGNIYADEVLYEVKLHPETLVSKLDQADWQRLSQEIAKKLTFAISKGGTSDSDYLNANGEKGGMQDFLNVYHQTGTKCPRACGGEVERIKVAGRSTHFCPVCQRKK